MVSHTVTSHHFPLPSLQSARFRAFTLLRVFEVVAPASGTVSCSPLRRVVLLFDVSVDEVQQFEADGEQPRASLGSKHYLLAPRISLISCNRTVKMGELISSGSLYFYT